jgi:hypothetical protein
MDFLIGPDIVLTFYGKSRQRALKVLASKEGQIVPSSKLSYEQICREFCDFPGPAGRLRRLDSVTVTDIERFIAKLRADGRSASTINKLVWKFGNFSPCPSKRPAKPDRSDTTR